MYSKILCLPQLTAIEDNVARAKQGDIRIAIHRLELDRIRFVLVDYLRCRLGVGASGFNVKFTMIVANVFSRRERSFPRLILSNFTLLVLYLSDVQLFSDVSYRCFRLIFH